MRLTKRIVHKTQEETGGVPTSPSRHAPDHDPGDVVDASETPRVNLRLVRLRLVLALLAAAVVPIALATPILVRVGQEMQARVGPAEASAAVSRLSADLASVRERVLAARLADPLAGAVDGKPGAPAKAIAVLDRIATADADAITGVWLLDGAGKPLATTRLPALHRGVVPLPLGDARAAVTGAGAGADPGAPWTAVVDRPAGADLYIAAPIAGSDPKNPTTGTLLVRMSVESLLADAQTGLGGSLVAYVRTAAGPLALESAAAAFGTSLGERLPVQAAGFEDWSIAIRSRPVQFDIPIQLALVALLLSSGALVLAWWLARQVIRPAQELDQQSARLGELYETARTHALEDSLTGLGNHRAFQDEFDRQLELSRRYNHPVSLLLVDLDDFKLVNDSAGHAVGDQMLVEYGRLLRSVLRRSDRAFRIGGDEFAVLMPYAEAEAAAMVARRLLSACSEPRPTSAFTRGFAFSGGVSACPDFSTSRSELFAQADAALYESKRHGRTTVTVFDPTISRADVDQQARAELSSRVARVVAVGALSPVYQPIVDLVSGRVLGFEGLIRPSADSGFADAATLFEAAEQSGRTLDLDRACLEMVIRGARQLAPDQTLSLNLSPRSMEAPEFNAGSLVRLLARHGIEPGRVTIELTEREAVEDLPRLRSVAAALQAAGLKIAADDIGAGNAGLRLLSQVRFDVVKIDLALVQDGEVRDSALAVMRALTELAQRWGAMVVAEGVETPGQLWAVKALGMSAAQGYLLGRPSADPSARSVDLEGLLALADDEPGVLRNRLAIAPTA